MDKRTILAFVLSLAVLLLWSFVFSDWFAPKQEQAPPKEETDIPRKGAGPITDAVDTPIPKPEIPPEVDQEKDKLAIPKTEEKVIEVETPLYKAIFSSAGAVIKSFKLKKYHLTTEPDSPLIELVHLEKSGADFVEINFDDPARPKSGKVMYQVDKESISLGLESPPQELTFSSVTSDGISVNQIFHFYPDKYQIDLGIKLSNYSDNQVGGNLKAYLTNQPPEKEGYYSFVGVALLLNDKLEEIKPDKMEEEKSLSGRIEWMAYEEDYFITAIIPEDQSEGSFTGQLLPSGILNATYIAPSISLRSREQISSHFTLYLGPRDLTQLRPIGKKLDKAVNFGWFDIIARPLLYTLLFINKYVKNYGVSIIILTILIKILFWPLTHKSYKSMKEMQKLQPLMAKLKEKYKDNKQQMQKETMALYKTYKVNPMGGCLPMIIQIPVFFALFRILGGSIELRHAPFILWITDLSAPDRLFSFPFQIPFMSAPYGIPVLTLLMGASMFIQQKMTPTPGDPAQAKIMMFLPIIFTVMFINFASGLVLYWLTNNLLSIGQQYSILKKSA
jgi:YidC/Oxa1 family membrane protein insertase